MKFSIKKYIKDHPYKTAGFIALGVLGVGVTITGIVLTAGLLAIPVVAAGAGAAVSMGTLVGGAASASAAVGGAATISGVAITAGAVGGAMYSYAEERKQAARGEVASNFKKHAEGYGIDLKELEKLEEDIRFLKEESKNKNIPDHFHLRRFKLIEAFKKFEARASHIKPKTYTVTDPVSKSPIDVFVSSAVAKDEKNYYEARLKAMRKNLSFIYKEVHSTSKIYGSLDSSPEKNSVKMHKLSKKTTTLTYGSNLWSKPTKTYGTFPTARKTFK